MDAVIGIDGGGTKTNAIAMDLDGHIIGHSTSGSMNYNFLLPEEAAQNVCRAILCLSETYALKIRAIAIGDPSIDDVSGCVPDASFLHRIYDATGLRENIPVIQKSDVFMALYGLTFGHPGAMIISGTGSMGIAIDEQGKLINVGGWGVPTADKGSGYAIARAAIQAVYDAEDGVGAPTALTSEALSFFGNNNLREMSYTLNNNDCSRSHIASFARRVADCAAKGDAVSVGILEQAADELAAYANILLDTIHSDDAPVGIFGGVFQNNSMVTARFTQAVNCHEGKHAVGYPQLPPEEAAALYLLDHDEEWRNLL